MKYVTTPPKHPIHQFKNKAALIRRPIGCDGGADFCPLVSTKQHRQNQRRPQAQTSKLYRSLSSRFRSSSTAPSHTKSCGSVVGTGRRRTKAFPPRRVASGRIGAADGGRRLCIVDRGYVVSRSIDVPRFFLLVLATSHPLNTLVGK